MAATLKDQLWESMLSQVYFLFYLIASLFGLLVLEVLRPHIVTKHDQLRLTHVQNFLFLYFDDVHG